MAELRDVKVGDRVVMARGRLSAPTVVQAVGAVVIVADDRTWFRDTGLLVAGASPFEGDHLDADQPVRLLMPGAHHREAVVRDVGAYLSALLTQVMEPVDAGADLDSRLDRLSFEELCKVASAGQKLCELLGVRP